MSNMQTITLAGKRFVIIEENEFDKMRRAGSTSTRGSGNNKGLPQLPKADEKGRVPAIAYARASIARSVIEQRRSAGLSQQALADLAGIRQETLSRIESGKHTATVGTVQRIDRAIRKLSNPKKRTA